MHQMFMSATSFNGIFDFSTGNVTDMSSMFETAASFEGNGLSSFDTSRVSNMASMFYGASALVDGGLVTWNVQNNDDFSYIFAGASSFNQNLCPWRSQLLSSGSIAKTEYMFVATSCPRKDDPDGPIISNSSSFCAACEGLPTTTDPTPSPVAGFSGQAFTSTQELRNAVDSYILDSSSTTATALKYGYPIGNWNVGQVSDFSSVFSAKRNPLLIRFDEELGGWNLDSAVTTASMFEGCVSFTDSESSLANWSVANVANMNKMFANCFSFAGDISQWDVRNVQDFSHFLEFGSEFQSDLSNWRPLKAENLGWMFRGAKSFISDISSWNLTSANTLETMVSFGQEG